MFQNWLHQCFPLQWISLLNEHDVFLYLTSFCHTVHQKSAFNMLLFQMVDLIPYAHLKIKNDCFFTAATRLWSHHTFKIPGLGACFKLSLSLHHVSSSKSVHYILFSSIKNAKIYFLERLFGQLFLWMKYEPWEQSWRRMDLLVYLFTTALHNDLTVNTPL